MSLNPDAILYYSTHPRCFPSRKESLCKAIHRRHADAPADHKRLFSARRHVKSISKAAQRINRLTRLHFGQRPCAISDRAV